MFSRRAIFGLQCEKGLVQSTSKPQKRVTDSFLSLLLRVCSAEHVNFLVLQLTYDNSNLEPGANSNQNRFPWIFVIHLL